MKLLESAINTSFFSTKSRKIVHSQILFYAINTQSNENKLIYTMTLSWQSKATEPVTAMREDTPQTSLQLWLGWVDLRVFWG